MNWFPPCRIVAHKHMACQQQGLTPALRALLTHHALICLVAIKAENPKYEHVQTLSTEAPFMHYFFGEYTSELLSVLYHIIKVNDRASLLIRLLQIKMIKSIVYCHLWLLAYMLKKYI